MKVVEQPLDIGPQPASVALAIGAFDGLHLGHRALLSATQALADEDQGETWVLTFQPHPLKILHPEKAPDLLTSLEQKLKLLEEAGVDGVILMPFNHDLSRWEPEDFLSRLAREIPQLKQLVVGPNWRFGRKGRGDIQLLNTFTREKGLTAHIVDPVVWEDQTISSTRIRSAVRDGDMEAASAMLGRPYSLCGTVIEGRKAGRELGFPTANLLPPNQVLPAAGIYAARTAVKGTLYDSAIYLDPNHPVGGEATIESHLIDVDIDLYGEEVEVFFIKHLRSPQHFDSREEALRQIGEDVSKTRKLLI